MEFKNAKIMIVGFALLLTACGGGFKGTSNCSTPSCLSLAPFGDGSGSGLSGSNQLLKEADVDGNITSGQYAGLHSIYIDPDQKMLVLTLPMPAVADLPQGGLEIPSLPGSSVTLSQVQDGMLTTPTLVVEIPLKYFVKGANWASTSQLPGGTEIAVPDGELPALAFDLTSGKYKMTIYLGPDVIGVFVNTPFDLPIYLYSTIKNQAQTKTLGYFMLIPKFKNNNIPGIFLSLKVPDDVGRILDQLL